MNVAIIPARYNSKSIKNKNLQRVGPTSLIDRAIKSAIESGVFDKIIISTDIPSVLDEYCSDKRVIVRPRPESLCQDETLMKDTVLDILTCLKIKAQDIVFVLQPTSPFRDKKDYNSILDIMNENKTNSVISMVDVGANHPNRMYTVKDNEIHPLRHTRFSNKQDLIRVYIRSGHYYVFRCGKFKEDQNFYIKPCRPFFIDHQRSINIDTPMDLAIARLLTREKICL